MKRLITFLLITGLASCDRSVDTDKNSTTTKADSTIAVVNKVKRPEIKLPLTNTSSHLFSDKTHPDTFKITMTGDSVINGKIAFTITNYKNVVLYKDSFAATGLLYDAFEVIPNTQQREDTIIMRFETFFTTTNKFLRPAGIINDSYDPDLNYNDEELWKEIKSDSTTIGFLYSYGYEGTLAIAYSKTKKKVVPYFTSD